MIEFSILTAIGHPSPLSACNHSPISPPLSVLFPTERDFPVSEARIRHVGAAAAALSFKGVKLARMHLSPGQRIPSLSNSGARFGAVLAVGSTREEACARSREGARLITVEFDTLTAVSRHARD